MSSGSGNPYLNYTIFQFIPTTEEQLKTLHDLDEERNDGVIFLTRIIHADIGKPTDVMVKPSLKEEFVTKLEARKLPPKIIGRVSCSCSSCKC